MDGGAWVARAHGGVEAAAQPVEDGLAEAGVALFEALEIGADLQVDGVLAIAVDQQAAGGEVAFEAVVILLIKQAAVAGDHDGEFDARVGAVRRARSASAISIELFGDWLGLGFEDGGECLVGFGLAVAPEQAHVFGPQDAGVGQGGGAGFELAVAGGVAGDERAGDAGEGWQRERAGQSGGGNMADGNGRGRLGSSALAAAANWAMAREHLEKSG